MADEIMVVTIHQPEHFPYMGFFQKASAADLIVLLDTVKFRKNYFQNRNRIVDRSGKEIWLTVPVKKGSSSILIKDVEVSRDERWRRKILATINQNLNFDASFLYDYEMLSEINIAGIKWAFKELNIRTEIFLASDLNIEGSKSELLANICKELGASKYISGPSGRDYLNESLFQKIEIEYFQPNVRNYLSCLDTICRNKN